MGTGNTGRALGVRWGHGGHQVLFSSRDRRKAEAGPGAQATAPPRSVVLGLVEELGFTAVDCGPLERTQLVEAAADLVRSQIPTIGAGPLTPLSLRSLATGSAQEEWS